MTPCSATVRFSYKAVHENELDLEVDDVIDVLEEAEVGWMKGKLRKTGRSGLFPTNFVCFLDNAVSDNDHSVTNNIKKKISDAIVSGELSPENSVSTTPLVADLTKGRVDTHVSDICSGKDNLEYDGANSRARVLFTYTPKHEDELALLEVGQIIAILSKSTEDPGWLLAEIEGKRGLVPDNFVEIIEFPASSNETNSEAFKVLPPPNVPLKPAPKSPSLFSGMNRRATTSAVFAQMHSTLADAFTKPPKQFNVKALRTEEGSAVGEHSGDRLSHITATRPKQPNKRPPSTIFLRRKSSESSFDIVSGTNTVSPTSKSSAQQPLSIAPSIKSTKGQSTLSPKSSENNYGDFVPHGEYIRLAQQFEEFRCEMNNFRLEMLQKLAALETKISKQV